MEESLRLLVVDPDLASAIKGAARRRAALREITAGSLELAPGQQFDRDVIAARGAHGVVVLGGFLVREWTTGGHISADLLGPEDVIHPYGGEPMIAMMRHVVLWTALTPVRLALLDDEFFKRAARWPEIAACLLERGGRLGQRLALRGAIETLSVDARLLASFWLWASQWATVAGQGVVLRIPLSHERIARLIHARRPTVTSAIGRLRGSGLIHQRSDGSWLLRGPVSDGDAEVGKDGVAMPVLAEMLERRLGVRMKTSPMSSPDARALATRELRSRLAEQREILRVATKRHEEMLERLRRETGRLTNAGARPDERTR